ncbi:MAG: ECF transporter S component [Spirochaetia bacterium]|jgi:uncharacterized membrane protein|nr:ECF transporter S component [Spirochaetia bacterium]
MSGSDKFTDTTAFRIAAIAVLSAIVTIFTIAIRIPIAPTRGYINLGDVAIYFAAFVFGPVSAFFAGGIGTALADILGGYGQWAPISFLVHGLQGLLVGIVYNLVLAREKDKTANIFITGIICFLTGSLIMVSGYFLASVFMVGPGAALFEVPGNIIQNIAGVVGGIILSFSVRKAYPPVVNFRW